MVELIDKILSQTDIDHRLAFPTASLRAIPIPDGETDVYFQATDTSHSEWNFRLSIRENDRYNKPVLTGDWLQFVRQKGLKAGDKIVLNMEEGAYGVSYTIRAERKIFKVGPMCSNGLLVTLCCSL